MDSLCASTLQIIMQPLMFTFIVTELSNTPVRSVNDELRSPVMQAELHINLAWSIF